MDLIGPVVKVISRLFCILQGVNCSKVSCVLLPSGCSKSFICSNMMSREESILLDLDSLSMLSLSKDQLDHLEKLKSEGSSNALALYLLPLYKQTLKDLRQKFKSKNIIIFTSEPQVLTYMKSLINKRYVWVPSESFFSVCLEKVDETAKKRMVSSRTSIISQFGRKSRIFSSWSDLGSQLGAELQLTQRV